MPKKQKRKIEQVMVVKPWLWPSVLLLLILGLVVFAPAFNNAFVMDDEAEISQNDLIHSLSHISNVFLGSTMNQGGTSSLGGIYYRPMMMASFSLIWNLVSESPAAFRILQLALHLLCAVFVLLLMRRWLRAETALLIAVFFLIHPMNVEPAIYISSLQDPLFLCFGLGAFLIATGAKELTFQSALSVSLLFLLALLSKETAALLMAMVLVWSYEFAKPRFRMLFFGAVGAFAAYALLRFGVAGLNALKDPTTQIARASTEVRLLTVPLALWTYLWKFVYPGALAVTEDWLVTAPDLREFWLPLAGDLAVFAGAFWVGSRLPVERRKLYWLFLIWASLGFFLHSHLLVPIDGTVSDRWFYFTSIGWIGVFAVAIESVKIPGRIVFGAFMVLAFVFAVRSSVRTFDWKDGYTLYAHDVEVSPETFYLHNNLGVELFRRGDFEAAQSRFEKSIALFDNWSVSWSNLGAIYQHKGNAAKAEECYARSIQAGPYLLAYENYAELLTLENRVDEAHRFLTDKGLKQFPGSAKLRALSGESGLGR